MKRSALFWLTLATSVGFSYLVVRGVNFADVGRALRTSNYWWIVPAAAALAASVLLRALRWRMLFAPETRPALGAALGALLISYFFNNILPARAGEVARVIALNRRAGVSRVEAAATVVIERGYDIVSLLVLLFVAVPWLPRVSWLHASALLGGAVAAGLAGLGLIFTPRGERLLNLLLGVVGRSRLVSPERARLAAANARLGLVAVRRPGLAFIALALTTASWLVMAISFWLLMLAFGLGLSPLAGLLVVIAVNLALILPSAPAAVGVFEAGALVALGAYGFSKSEALPYALVLHMLNFVPYLVAGAVVLYDHGRTARVVPIQSSS